MNLSAHTREWVSSVEIERRTARFWIVVVLPEGFLLLAYFARRLPSPLLRFASSTPFVWINAGLWAVRRVTPHSGTRTHRAVGIVIAIAYLFVVLYIPGTIGFGATGTPTDLRIAMYAPGGDPRGIHQPVAFGCISFRSRYSGMRHWRISCTLTCWT